MRNIFLFAMILTILNFTSCTRQRDSGDAETPKVKTLSFVQKELPDETSGFGSLSFLTKVDITSSQEGTVSRLYFREGDTAIRGRTAALLKNPQIEIAVERAENNYTQALAALELSRSRLQDGELQAEAQLLSINKAEAELEQSKKMWEEERRRHQNQEVLYEAGGLHDEAIRASRFSLETEWEKILLFERELDIRRIGCRDQDLTDRGIVVPETEAEKRQALIFLLTAGLRAELGVAAARLEAAEKELASVRLALDELRITSPATGVVGARYYEEGERIKAGEKVFTIMDTASLYAIFPVREKDALRITKGMKALVSVDGTGELRHGTVDLVYPQADSQSLSFLVRVLLDGSPGELKPGMFARVVVTLGAPRRIAAIPESSVINKRGNEGTVFVLNGSQVSERTVSLGVSLGEEREIVSGLSAGDIVVLEPTPEIREGIYVSLAE